MDKQKLGKWAFLIGLIIAVLAGIISAYSEYVPFALFILGLIVGFLNISEKTSTKFLTGVIALMLLGVGSINALSMLNIISDYLNAILGNFIAFVSAAALIVALKVVLETSRS